MSDTTKHTPVPWKRDKYGHLIAADGREVVFRSMTCLTAGSDERVAEAEANTDLVAVACSSYQALVDALEASNAKFAKLATWLDRLATADEERAKDTRFQSLAEACAADARNYRNTAADIQRTVSLNDAALELVKGKA